MRKESELRTRLEAVAADESGFTLIEMSIVLVIIGLLIGGVLKGQELIDSTRLKSVVTQWDAVKAATNGFQDRYNAMPGDYSQANTVISANGVAVGDGNGIIGTAQANGALFTANGIAGENLNFWAHLAAGHLVSGVTVGTTANTAQVAASGGIMPGRIANTFWTVIEGTDNADYGVWIRLQVGTGGTGTSDSLTPKQAAEIERKYDDSSGIAGSIHGSNVGGTACLTAGAYNALVSNKNCSLAFVLQ
jgi:prepilin-type N-terminal cleavage/methylation domain-containing protein